MFFVIEKSEETSFNFSQMETQKMVNLSNDTDNENSKYVTKEWFVIDSESKCVYSHKN